LPGESLRADTDTYTHTHGDTNRDTNGYTYAETNSDTTAASNAAPAPDSLIPLLQTFRENNRGGLRRC
jgi:hypothetical protein